MEFKPVALDRVIRKFEFYTGALDDIHEFVLQFVRQIENVEIEVKVSRASDIYEKLQATYETMIESCDMDEAELETHSTAMNEVMQKYHEILVMGKRRLQVAEGASGPTAPRAPAQSLTVKLPTMSLPDFDGTPDSWVSFKDLFEAVIHKHPSMSDIEKFNYLVAHFKPKGVNILSQYSLSSDMYADAWNAVCHRYDDKRKIAARHFSGMIATEAMSKNSAIELRQVIDSFESSLSALDKVGFKLSPDNDFAHAIIVHMVMQCLHGDLKLEWFKHIKDANPTWTCLRDFLVAHWRSLEDAQGATKTSKTKTEKPATPSKTGRVHAAVESTGIATTKETQCVVCNQGHFIHKCTQFQSMSPESRRQVVMELKLCRNCLAQGHRQKDCKSRFACRECKARHHTLLHVDTEKKEPSAPRLDTAPSNGQQETVKKFQSYQMDAKPSTSGHVNAASGGSFHAVNHRTQTILPTVMVKIKDSQGNWKQCRALLDSGSDIHFITKECFDRLGLKSYTHPMQVKGISERMTVCDQCTEAQLYSNYGPFNPLVGMMVMPDLVGVLPCTKVDTRRINLPSSCFLADPLYHQPGPIDILIGSDVYYQSLLDGKHELDGGTILVETKFGWTVVAKVPIARSQSTFLCGFSYLVKATGSEVDDNINKFLKADEFDVPIVTASPEQRFCEELFQQTTTKEVDGRFMVTMPFKSNPTALGTNFDNAKKMFFIQEARRQKDPLYNDLYVEYMRDYLGTKHMTEVSSARTSAAHYLPHHGVLKMSSTSTKLRPVFNASKSTESGISLNDILCVGPTVQPDSFDVLSRFREHRFVLIADITKMYRQIWVDKSQRDFLRILWRENSSEPLRHYQLNTVTFGTSCAPSIATRCIVQAAMDNETQNPAASAAIRNCFYVDDLNYGTDDIAEGLQVRESIRKTFLDIGMTLCKFASNEPQLLANLPENLLNSSAEDPNSLTRTLGIGFDTKADEFFYAFKTPKVTELTRASVLSQIASLYDPIGWIGPVVLSAKLIMKAIVMHNVGWSEKLPEGLAQNWQSFHSKIHFLSNVRIPRQCYITNHRIIEIHGFSDASIQAYGAVIYARSIDGLGSIQTSLLTSKSRVAPKNQKTLARLELCGMTLLAQLVHRMRAVFAKPITSITLWSDSTIGIHWIALEPHNLSTFVGNRTAVVRELTHELTWKHIRGPDNPADIISRGLQPEEVKDCRLWWEGPEFFTRPQSEWPESILTINENDPELQSEIKKSLLVVHPLDQLSHLIDARFSSVRKLFNTFAYIIRMVTRRPQRTRGPLTVDELNNAESVVIRLVQKLHFAEDYKLLAQQKESQMAQAVNKRSRLSSLSPYIDEVGIMRVRGRLAACRQFAELQKHPIILPNCHFSTCLIRQIHTDMLHSNHQATFGYVREYYWVLHAKNVIRKVIHECITCFRAQPPSTTQLMSDLPSSRVNMTPPFTYTAVDYTGHYLVKFNRGRMIAPTKCYISIFRCMCTGSIHIELVSDLSTKAFVAALDRFFSRRGNCLSVFSDNGTCFEGCDNHLRVVVEQHNSAAEDHCKIRHIQWTFTTPRAPHAGGVYEIAVKLVKHHVRRVIGDSLFTFEEFQTVLCKIEAILNSRPLTPLSNNPDDLSVLTPGHFLIGRPLCAIPQQKFLNVRLSYVKRWERVQQAQQLFWSLWYRDYLHEKQLRPQDFREERKVDIGSLVLMNDSNLPPLKWQLGRIVKLYTGRDGVVRSVRLRTAHGEKDRHIRYLSFLPVEQP